jgi:hypothetical protein
MSLAILILTFLSRRRRITFRAAISLFPLICLCSYWLTQLILLGLPLHLLASVVHIRKCGLLNRYLLRFHVKGRYVQLVLFWDRRLVTLAVSCWNSCLAYVCTRYFDVFLQRVWLKLLALHCLLPRWFLQILLVRLSTDLHSIKICPSFSFNLLGHYQRTINALLDSFVTKSQFFQSTFKRLTVASQLQHRCCDLQRTIL